MASFVGRWNCVRTVFNSSTGQPETQGTVLTVTAENNALTLDGVLELPGANAVLSGNYIDASHEWGGTLTHGSDGAMETFILFIPDNGETFGGFAMPVTGGNPSAWHGVRDLGQ